VQRKSNWIDQLLKTKSNVFLNPDDENYIDADEMLTALTEEWGDPQEAAERRAQMEQMKSEKIRELQNRERADCLAQLSILRGAAFGYKGDKGSTAYQARMQKGMRIAKMLENNPTMEDKTVLRRREPFIYNRMDDACIFKNDYVVDEGNVYQIDKLNTKNMTVHGVRISKRKYGNAGLVEYDHGYEFSEQLNVTKRYGNREKTYLTNVPKEEVQYMGQITNEQFYEIPSEAVKEKYYYINQKTYDETVRFYHMDGALKIRHYKEYDRNHKEIRQLNPFNAHDKDKIISLINKKKYGFEEYGKEKRVEEILNYLPDIYRELAKTDKTIKSPLQIYLEKMEIDGISDFKKYMKEMPVKFPEEFGKDSLKAAQTIMQNTDNSTRQLLNKELVKEGCDSPNKTKKLFDAWLETAGLNKEKLKERVTFTGVAV
jgi:hypothetical protein